MAEARNIRNLSMQQTPLFGGENTPLHELVGRGSGFEGATPRGAVAATPNPLATPFRSSESDASMTPMSSVGGRPGATPLRTPMRDSLQINADDMSAVGDTPRQRMSDLKNQLKAGFSSLPTPQNNFVLVDPEDVEDDEIAVAMRIEDGTEREARLAAIHKAEEERMLARRTQAVKRGLPRPANFDDATAARLLADLDLAAGEPALDPSRAEAERLVAIEMVHLLEHDAIAHPVPGGRRAGGGASRLAFIDDERLAAARALVHTEMAESIGLPGANEALLKRTIALESAAFDDVWRPAFESLAYDAQSRSYVDVKSLSDTERIAGLRALLDMNRDVMAKESAKAAKTEKKLGVTLGGYVARTKALGGKLVESVDELARTRVELNSFERLADQEVGAMTRRAESLRDEVQKLERREREGQDRFRELNDLKMALASEIEAMELEEAEAINDRMLAMDEE